MQKERRWRARIQIVIDIPEARYKDIKRIAEVQLDRRTDTVEQIIAKGVPFVGRWIPVSERLPDNNARVLCCATSTSISGGYTRFVGCCNNGFWFVQTSAETLSYPRQYEVTAWTPLPEPYKAESEDT